MVLIVVGLRCSVLLIQRGLLGLSSDGPTFSDVEYQRFCLKECSRDSADICRRSEGCRRADCTLGLVCCNDFMRLKGTQGSARSSSSRTGGNAVGATSGTLDEQVPRWWHSTRGLWRSACGRFCDDVSRVVFRPGIEAQAARSYS
jgi:hypothetical protein